MQFSDGCDYLAVISFVVISLVVIRLFRGGLTFDLYSQAINVERQEAHGLPKPSESLACGRRATPGWGDRLRARTPGRQRVQGLDQGQARSVVGHGKRRRPQSR